MKSQTHKGEQQSFNRLRNETWSVAAEQVSASPFKDEVKNFGIVCRIHGISGECSSQRAFEPLRSGWICQHLRNFRIFRRAGFLVVHHVRFLLDGLSCLSRSSSIPDYFRPSSFGSLTPRSKPNRTSQRRTNLLFRTPCPAAVLARVRDTNREIVSVPVTSLRGARWTSSEVIPANSAHLTLQLRQDRKC